MKFGAVPLAEAEGGILAHRVSSLAKGKVISSSDIRDLAQAGVETVVVARLEADDVGEDDAAHMLATALTGDAAGLRLTTASTGRVNVVATRPGLAAIDADAINAVNSVDPMVTVATVPNLYRMEAGGLLATIKIISYAASRASMDLAVGRAVGGIGLRHPQGKSVSLIETYHGDQRLSDKGERSLVFRLEQLDSSLQQTSVVPHDTELLAAKLEEQEADIICLLTASATSDVGDVGPEALKAAGGELIHFGMPVDPGNLLFIGRLGEKVVLGLPGCARSPALNGADWVLERLLCGVDVQSRDIIGMGVGGLLKEIPSRPRPRRSDE